MSLSWSHAVLHVQDRAKMLAFYTDILGFDVTDEGPLPGRGTDIVFLSQDPDEHHQIAFVSGSGDRSKTGSLAHLAFRVPGLPELREMITKLEAEIGALRLVTHGNTWSAYFQDPDGNGVEIFCDTPWDVSQPVIEKWDPDMDDATLLEWTRQNFQNAPASNPASDGVGPS